MWRRRHLKSDKISSQQRLKSKTAKFNLIFASATLWTVGQFRYSVIFNISMTLSLLYHSKPNKLEIRNGLLDKCACAVFKINVTLFDI